MKIKDVEQIYTGGNIWCFLGVLDDGNYFIACDDMLDVTIVSEDPRKTEDAWFAEWQEKNLVRYLNEKESIRFFRSLCKFILKRPYEGFDGEYMLKNRLA